MFAKSTLCSMLLLTAIGLLPFISNAATASWTQANQAVVDQHIIPGYTKLAASTQALAQQAKQFCQSVEQNHFVSLRNAYQHSMDDWMRIQHIRMGPVGMYLRYNRYQLWPDKHGTGAKQLRRLLAEQDSEHLQQDKFVRASVAVQGFTALERLLYPSELKLADFRQDKHASYRCQLVETISNNLADMSKAVLNDWQNGANNYRKVILTAEQGNDYYGNAKDVSGVLLNDLHTQLVSIVEQKLMRPMERYRMKRAESWRSRRSLRNIALNLQACQAMYEIGFAQKVTHAELHEKITWHFEQTTALAQTLGDAIYSIQKDSPEAEKLQTLKQQTSELKTLLATDLPDAADLVLGFNSLDGD